MRRIRPRSRRTARQELRYSFRRILRRAIRKNPFLWVGVLLVCLFALSYGESGADGSGPARGSSPASSPEQSISCVRPVIVDGDTLRCNGVRVRLSGIDAPEMPGHCRQGRRCTPGDPHAAKRYLEQISRGGISCAISTYDHYDRAIALCSNGELDLSCAMVDAGHAVQRYNPLYCP